MSNRADIMIHVGEQTEMKPLVFIENPDILNMYS